MGGITFKGKRYEFDETPTEAQEGLLRSLGLEIPETREEASKAISDELEYRRERRAEQEELESEPEESKWDDWQ